MSACEECWAAAQRAVMLRGGSVVDHYVEALEAHAARIEVDAIRANVLEAERADRAGE